MLPFRLPQFRVPAAVILLLSTLRVVLRWLAGVFLIFAMIALMSDLTRSMNGTSIVTTSLATHWQQLSPQSLTSLKAGISRLHAVIWDPLIWKVLLLPTWLLFGTIGLSLAYVGRRQRRVNIFIN